jgi:opacity protein-like surface antigen
MKRLIATSVALAGMTGSALGADLGPPVELPWTWAGPYLGLHAGFGWSNDQANCISVKSEKESTATKKVKQEEKKEEEEKGGEKIKTASAGPDGGSGTGLFIVDGKIVQSSEAEAGPDGAEATADNGGEGDIEDHASGGHSSDEKDSGSSSKKESTVNCHFDEISKRLPVDTDSNGLIGGGQVGYNFQFHRLVMGIEGDISLTDWDGGSRDINWFGTMRGRLGYAWERVMPYVTGGLAIAGVDFNTPFVGSSSETMTGWTLGGGVEVAVSDNVSVRGEYLHFDLSDIDGDIVRAGINFRFWRPQPQPVLFGY